MWSSMWSSDRHRHSPTGAGRPREQRRHPEPPDESPDARDAHERHSLPARDFTEEPDAGEPRSGAVAFVGGVPLDTTSPLWRRHYARQLIRAFLRSVPRTEADATLVFPRPDGMDRVVTRAELTAAIERLHPRPRQVIRLAVEERWPRRRVSEYLRISLKTYERDLTAGLDTLAQI